VEFIARDGFTSPLNPELLQNVSPHKSIAYLAIEDPGNKWPKHALGEETAGPFYLLWVNPELSNVGREEWPFKFNRVVVREPLEERYGAMVPDTKFGHGHAVKKGFDVYVKNCIACHKLEKTGPGTMGPDLNYPMSPVEYFKEGILRKFIRDPQSIRSFPDSAMGGFSEKLLSEDELDQLILYLEYMAQSKGNNR
jgi:cytochrome c2